MDIPNGSVLRPGPPATTRRRGNRVAVSPPPFGLIDLLGLTLGEADRDFDELVFLPADELAAAGFDEDLGPGHAVLLCLDLRVPQEAGVHARIAHGERHAVERGRVALEYRRDRLLGGVDDLEGVDAGLDPEPLGDRGERLDRCVARAGAEPAGG